MRLHYLQHVPFEGLGYIQQWADENSITISSTKLFEKEKFPSQDEFDFLVIMGGPMDVNNEQKYNWLSAEKEFVNNTIKLNKPVLGICLGAQIIANVLGANVYPNKEKEIGWFDVSKVSTSHPSKLFEIFPNSINVFQWHGDTFNLPKGAILLAESEICKNQAFLYGEKVLALQFHLESTQEAIQKLIENCSDELIEAPFIQTVREMTDSESKIKNTNRIMKNILEFLSREVR